MKAKRRSEIYRWRLAFSKKAIAAGACGLVGEGWKKGERLPEKDLAPVVMIEGSCSSGSKWRGGHELDVTINSLAPRTADEGVLAKCCAFNVDLRSGNINNIIYRIKGINYFFLIAFKNDPPKTSLEAGCAKVSRCSGIVWE